ncbi:leucine-rich repeat and guanylate kinase domain-containing protein-like [Sitophilus oryzae]|uniref:Leucine-rich repeat and guanylate kinase domain-containing protein-like n=1 Tax=Sitophilus oryzae TaxID=7048 RepID=A0A6J2XLT4_SITOR|nr:leucine-rich repeat and guanylate kinase domain-containing protein-like [Sitophilus oryzae]
MTSTPGAYNSILIQNAATPSLINYMPSSHCGSTHDASEIILEPTLDSDTTTEEEDTTVPYYDEHGEQRCEELWRAYRDAAGLWISFRFNIEEWKSKGDQCDHTLFDDYDEIGGTEMENTVSLTKKIIASGLSRIASCPEFYHYAYTKCVLQKKKISDIEAIRSYRYLQYLDVSGNQLTTLKPLENLPFLKYLDASRNLLSTVLDFKAPFFLTVANLSRNKFEFIPDLADFWSITDLNLSHNRIEVIDGLTELKYLSTLNLSNNRITHLHNLDNLRIQFLYLHYNNLRFKVSDSDKCIRTLTFLRSINVSHNKIESTKVFERLENLECLEATYNEINQLLDVYYLRNLRFLFKLNLTGNPVTEKRKYTEICLTHLRKLSHLDGQKINTDFWNEKFSNKLSDVYQKASYTRLKLLILEQMNKPRIWDWLQPYDCRPLDVIVLVGVEGSKRAALARQFQKKYPQVAIGIPYTTREKHENEIEGEHYYYIDDKTFSTMLKEGQFLLFEQVYGASYGFTHSEFQKAKYDIIIFYTNLVMGLALRNTFLNTRLVLTIPSTPRALLEGLKTLYAIKAEDATTLKLIPSPIVAEECRKQFAAERSVFIRKEVESILDVIVDHVCTQGAEDDEYDMMRTSLGTQFTTFTEDTGSFIEDLVVDPEEKSVSSSQPSKNISCMGPQISAIKRTKPMWDTRSAVTTEFYLEHQTYMDCMTNDETIRKIYQVVLKEREELLDMHWSMPGLFRDLCFSDYEEESLEKLEILLHDSHKYNAHKPLFNFEKDPCVQAIIDAKIHNCFNSLKREINISAKQAKEFEFKNEKHICDDGICRNPGCPAF